MPIIEVCRSASKFFVCRRQKNAEPLRARRLRRILGVFQDFLAKAGEKFAVEMRAAIVGTASEAESLAQTYDSVFCPAWQVVFCKISRRAGCRRISLAYPCRWWYTINAKTNKGSMIPHKVGPTGELPLSDGPFVLVCLSRAGQATCRCSVPLHLLPPTQKIQQRCRTMTPPPLCYQSGKEAASSV